ncbi:hypothetical protein AB205_0061430 [Aquarana catesbeiana]|uniref:Uncharacterized protein n=1 Tax=Aquarana catesbeiana TaxID=8400 RepID=A0A2G9SB36_AQUCT|nr:hypothetical protein AB205_0061430 [Aquarana catesbeiana]
MLDVFFPSMFSFVQFFFSFIPKARRSKSTCVDFFLYFFCTFVTTQSSFVAPPTPVILGID